jgi:hypothetical protein
MSFHQSASYCACLLSFRGTNFGPSISIVTVSVSGVSGSHIVSFVNHTHLFFTLGGTPTSSSAQINVVVSDRSAVAPLTVPVVGPVITAGGLSPANGPAIGGYNLTVTGSGFGDGVSRVTSVFIGATPCPVLSVTGFNRIVCLMPSGFDSQDVQVTVGTQQSNSVVWYVCSILYLFFGSSSSSRCVCYQAVRRAVYSFGVPQYRSPDQWRHPYHSDRSVVRYQPVCFGRQSGVLSHSFIQRHGD